MSSDKLKGEIVAHEIKLARYRSNLVSDSLFSLLTNTTRASSAEISVKIVDKPC